MKHFSKTFCLARNGGHSEFFAKIATYKNPYISKTMQDRAISTKFLIHRVSLQSSHLDFPKIYVSPNMAAIFTFQLFAKFTKHNDAYILITVLDRAILTKFWTHRVSLRSSHPNFQNILLLPKMAAILNFRIFRKNYKTQKCLYLEN